MYAFGDVKEPANDTIDVMEEILMEYLVDVVSNGRSWCCQTQSLRAVSVIQHSPQVARREYRSKISGVHSAGMRTERSWHVLKNFFSCRTIYEELGNSFPPKKRSSRSRFK